MQKVILSVCSFVLFSGLAFSAGKTDIKTKNQVQKAKSQFGVTFPGIFPSDLKKPGLKSRASYSFDLGEWVGIEKWSYEVDDQDSVSREIFWSWENGNWEEGYQERFIREEGKLVRKDVYWNFLGGNYTKVGESIYLYENGLLKGIKNYQGSSESNVLNQETTFEYNQLNQLITEQNLHFYNDGQSSLTVKRFGYDSNGFQNARSFSTFENNVWSGVDSTFQILNESGNPLEVINYYGFIDSLAWQIYYKTKWYYSLEGVVDSTQLFYWGTFENHWDYTSSDLYSYNDGLLSTINTKRNDFGKIETVEQKSYQYQNGNLVSMLTETIDFESKTLKPWLKEDYEWHTPTSVEQSTQPEDFLLGQNYPNPFNPETTFSYRIASPAEVEIKVFDLSGKEVLSQNRGVQNSGTYSFTVNGSSLSSGIYLYKVKAGNLVQTKKMVLIK